MTMGLTFGVNGQCDARRRTRITIESRGSPQTVAFAFAAATFRPSPSPQAYGFARRLRLPPSPHLRQPSAGAIGRSAGAFTASAARPLHQPRGRKPPASAMRSDRAEGRVEIQKLSVCLFHGVVFDSCNPAGIWRPLHDGTG